MSRAEKPAAAQRVVYADVLRILAAFLVIVNHSNSRFFMASEPAQGVWWVSLLLYYLSKIAVPLFVALSGAFLLPRVDGYRKTGLRILRILGALLLFSYLLFLHDAWVNYGLWPRMLNVGAFLDSIWPAPILQSYWYLYFYLGLLFMLPLLQRMASALRARDRLYLIGMCFAFDALLPLLTHYLPQLAPCDYFQVPLFTGYIGLFFAGHHIRQRAAETRRSTLIAAAALVGSLAASLLLTYLEFQRVGAGEKYWFMDDFMRPSLPTVIAALSVMVLFKRLPPVSARAQRMLGELSACAFGVYLLQDWLLIQTDKRFFRPVLCSFLPDIPAVLIWDVLIFALAAGITWLMRRVPWVRKLL